LGLFGNYLDNWHALCIDAGMTGALDISHEPFDVERRFIRIVEDRSDGLVAFEFAAGEPDLYVEMILPRAEFEDFCRMQGVVPTQGRLPQHEQDSLDAHWDWNLRDARERNFRDLS